MRYFSTFLLIVLLLPLIGCSNNVSLHGRVTFSDDGTPLTTGMVVFTTSTFVARGEIGSDGTYTLGSVSESDGIPPGIYRVYINNAVKITGNDKSGGAVMAPLVDPKYQKAETSGLTYEVKRGASKTFDFAVDRP